MTRPDLDAAQATFEELLERLKIDIESDEQLSNTPARVTKLWSELFGGLHEPVPTISRFPNDGQGEPVILRALPFYSMCAHHFLPFFGTFDIAYIPGDVIGGVGSFARVVRYFGQRPQVQERLVQQVADLIEEALSPAGLYVRSTARHLCMEMRGERVAAELVCTAARGVLRDGERRQEVLSLLG